MKNSFKDLSTFLFVLFLLTYSACRKTDQTTELQKETPKISAIEERFFNTNRTTDPTEKTLVEFIKRRNEKEQFAKKAIQQIGYPRWDKIVSSKTQHAQNSLTETDPPSPTTVYYIPFVRDSQNFVNASLVVVAQQTDTSISFACDWQYKSLPHGAANSDTTAERFALFFMTLDKLTFGYNEFDITDTTLFPLSRGRNGGVKKLGFVSNGNTSQNQINLLETLQLCFENYVCGDPDWCAAHGGCDYEHCAAGPTEEGHCYLESEVCFDIYEPPTGGGGGTSGGSGGGGSGTGGGSSGGGGTQIPECEDPNSACGPGWENPTPDYDDNGDPLDGIFTIQKNIVNTWKNVIVSESNLRKGNFGEIASDVKLQQRGYAPYHNRITNINQSGHHGIDGLFKKGNTWYIVEAKYQNPTLPSVGLDGTPTQLSNDWLNGQQPTNNPGGWTRVQYAAGSQALGNTVMSSNPIRLISRILPDGTVKYYQVTPNGTAGCTISNTEFIL